MNLCLGCYLHFHSKLIVCKMSYWRQGTLRSLLGCCIGVESDQLIWSQCVTMRRDGYCAGCFVDRLVCRRHTARAMSACRVVIVYDR